MILGRHLVTAMAAGLSLIVAGPVSAADQSRPTAVVTRDGGSKVFQVVDGRAKLLTISTGPARQDQVVVTNGLGGTETIIVNPPSGLKDGDKVTSRQ